MFEVFHGVGEGSEEDRDINQVLDEVIPKGSRVFMEPTDDTYVRSERWK